MRQIAIGIFYLFWAAFVNAEAITVSPQDHWPLDLTGRISIFEDTSGKLTVNDIAALPIGTSAGFQTASSSQLQPSDSRSVWWLRLAVTNAAVEPLRLHLLPGGPSLEYLDFFREQEGHWQHTRSGERIPLSEQKKSERLQALTFVVSPAATTHIFAKIQSGKTISLVPRLYTHEAYTAINRQLNLWDGVLFGGLFALGWGALMHALFSRSVPSFILGLLSWNVLLYEASVRGYSKLYLWPQAGEWAYRSGPVLGYLSMALFIVFLYSASKNTKAPSSLKRYLLGFGALEALMALYACFGDIHRVIQFGGYLSLLFAISLVVVGLFLLKSTLPSRKLMLLSAAFFLVQISLHVTEQFSLLPNFIADMSIGGVAANPMLALIGFGINIAVFAAWVSHVANQRNMARDTLFAWQEQEQARLENEVAIQTHALSQALQYAEDKNRQKSETLSYISHDLRAPLATIIGYVWLLQNTQTPEQAPHMRAIERSANYQLTLIDELLEYAQGDLQPLQIKTTPLDLPVFVKDMCQYAQALSQAQENRFIFECQSTLPVGIQIDGRRLQQVLLNLLSNAAKFTHRGTIKLAIKAHETDAGWRLGFVVEDTGIGIDAAEQSNVFNAFTQLRAKHGSAGLGLSIAQRIVEAMGATLMLRSEVGVGCRFSFEILADGAQAVTQALNEPVLTAMSRLTTPSLQFAQDQVFNKAAHSVYDAPPAHARLELATLAREGYLTDIENWLERLANDEGRYHRFLSEIRMALATLDLDKIEQLALSSEWNRDTALS